jgi:excisionase family DNA binding protein
MIYIESNSIKKLITEAVNEAIKPHIDRLLTTPNMKPVYTIDEVTEMFGVSKRHLQYLRDSGQIGYSKSGRKVLFRAEDLNKFFENHYIGRAKNG